MLFSCPYIFATLGIHLSYYALEAHTLKVKLGRGGISNLWFLFMGIVTYGANLTISISRGNF